jgi:hypothetical protein
MLLADSYVKVYEIGKLIQHGHDLKELELWRNYSGIECRFLKSYYIGTHEIKAGAFLFSKKAIPMQVEFR